MAEQLSDIYISDQGKLCFLKKEIDGIATRKAISALMFPGKLSREIATQIIEKDYLHIICFTTTVHE